MAAMTAGQLDGRNCGAVVHFVTEQGWDVVTTLDGVVTVDGSVLLYTPVQDGPFKVARNKVVNVYLASNAKYAQHSMGLLEDIAEQLAEVKILAELAGREDPLRDIEPYSFPGDEVVPMEVPC